MIHWITAQFHPTAVSMLLQNRKISLFEILAEIIICKKWAAIFFFFNLNWEGLQIKQHTNLRHNILRKVQNAQTP